MGADNSLSRVRLIGFMAEHCNLQVQGSACKVTSTKTTILVFGNITRAYELHTNQLRKPKIPPSRGGIIGEEIG